MRESKLIRRFYMWHCYVAGNWTKPSFFLSCLATNFLGIFFSTTFHKFVENPLLANCKSSKIRTYGNSHFLCYFLGLIFPVGFENLHFYKNCAPKPNFLMNMHSSTLILTWNPQLYKSLTMNSSSRGTEKTSDMRVPWLLANMLVGFSSALLMSLRVRGCLI